MKDANAGENKRLTSLLLYSVRGPKSSRNIFERYARLTDASAQFGALPRMELRYIGQEVNCTVDLTDVADLDAVYYTAIENVLQAYRVLIADLLAFEEDVGVYVTAQIAVSQELAVFELRAPKIPVSLSGFGNFMFSYSVWHLLKD